jgi:hypothetical protein
MSSWSLIIAFENRLGRNSGGVMNGGYNPEAAQLHANDIAAGGRLHEIIKSVREIKGEDGVFQLRDLLSLGPTLDDIVGFFNYVSEGDPSDPNDDVYIAERIISSGTAYGRGTGAFKKIGT